MCCHFGNRNMSEDFRRENEALAVSGSARGFRACFATGVIGAGFLASGCAPPVGGGPVQRPVSLRSNRSSTPLESAEGSCARPELRQTLAGDAYDRQVLSFCPVMYLAMSHPDGGSEPDLSGHDHDGVYLPAGDKPASSRLPNGDVVADFDGSKEYLSVASARELSVPNTGRLTVQAWIEPAVLRNRRGGTQAATGKFSGACLREDAVEGLEGRHRCGHQRTSLLPRPYRLARVDDRIEAGAPA